MMSSRVATLFLVPRPQRLSKLKLAMAGVACFLFLFAFATPADASCNCTCTISPPGVSAAEVDSEAVCEQVCSSLGGAKQSCVPISGSGKKSEQDAYGLGATASAAGLKATTLPQVIGRVINAALSLLGIAFFLLMLYAGFRWMTAQGDPEVVKKSRDTIVAAVIGLAIVIAAYAVVTFVFESVIP